MRILIEKQKRQLTVLRGAKTVFACPIALGSVPTGHKRREGDGKTPEGAYFVCLKRETGKYGKALGISYPSYQDAVQGGLSVEVLRLFEQAEMGKKRPPWGTALGGEIYIHGGGTHADWTAGCIALSDTDMAELFALIGEGDDVLIIP